MLRQLSLFFKMGETKDKANVLLNCFGPNVCVCVWGGGGGNNNIATNRKQTRTYNVHVLQLIISNSLCLSRVTFAD